MSERKGTLLDKTQVFLSQSFAVCWAALFALLFGLSLRYVEDWYWHLGAAVAICIVFFLLYCRCRERLDADDRLTRRWAVALLAIIFAQLLLVGKLMLIEPTSDSGTIWYSVADVVETGTISKEVSRYTSCYEFTKTSNHNYFLIYPMTRFMVAYLLPYCKAVHELLGVELRTQLGFAFGAGLNAVSILAAVWFGFLTVRKEKGNAAALLFLILCFLFLPYSLNVYRVYSDTLSLPYLTLSIYLFVLADRETRTGRRLPLFFTAGLAAAVGALLKGNIWILVIAALIYRLVRVRDRKKAPLDLLCAALGLLLVTQIWAFSADRLPWLDTTESDRYELPTMHWILMASEGDGGFDKDATEYMLSLDSVEARREAAIEKYIQRFHARGKRKFIEFTFRKITRVLSDGMFTQRNYLDRQEGRALEPFVTRSGEYYTAFRSYTWIFLYFVYLWIGVSAVTRAIRKKTDTAFLFHVCLFGLILFFSFWEVKARYLLNFTQTRSTPPSMATTDCAT